MQLITQAAELEIKYRSNFSIEASLNRSIRNIAAEYPSARKCPSFVITYFLKSQSFRIETTAQPPNVHRFNKPFRNEFDNSMRGIHLHTYFINSCNWSNTCVNINNCVRCSSLYLQNAWKLYSLIYAVSHTMTIIVKGRGSHFMR